MGNGSAYALSFDWTRISAARPMGKSGSKQVAEKMATITLHRCENEFFENRVFIC